MNPCLAAGMYAVNAAEIAVRVRPLDENGVAGESGGGAGLVRVRPLDVRREWCKG